MNPMIAARLHAYDAPMTLDRIEVPEPRPNDVLVEVKAYGVVPNLASVDLSRLEHRVSPSSKVNEVLAGMHDRNLVSPILLSIRHGCSHGW